MRRLYGDMSFQVTRPNGTKSNAIVEVRNIERNDCLNTEKLSNIRKQYPKSSYDDIVITGNLRATLNCISNFQRIDDRMGYGAGLRRKS